MKVFESMPMILAVVICRGVRSRVKKLQTVVALADVLGLVELLAVFRCPLMP